MVPASWRTAAAPSLRKPTRRRSTGWERPVPLRLWQPLDPATEGVHRHRARLPVDEEDSGIQLAYQTAAPRITRVGDVSGLDLNHAFHPRPADPGCACASRSGIILTRHISIHMRMSVPPHFFRRSQDPTYSRGLRGAPSELSVHQKGSLVQFYSNPD